MICRRHAGGVCAAQAAEAFVGANSAPNADLTRAARFPENGRRRPISAGVGPGVLQRGDRYWCRDPSDIENVVRPAPPLLRLRKLRLVISQRVDDDRHGRRGDTGEIVKRASLSRRLQI